MTSPPPATNRQVAFTNVNVVPMDEAQVLEDHTVAVQSGRISAVGPSGAVEIPTDAEVIDGHGGFLMPGLADMHTHLGHRDQNPAHLVLYLATGTTTVRSMGGAPQNQDWRRRVEEGELVGPTILTSGEALVGGLDDEDPDVVASLPIFVPSSPSEAAAEVRRQAAGWADLIKVYDGLTEGQYLAAIAAANEAGIYVAGHALDEASVETILTSGINEIAHLDELNTYHWLGFPGEPGFAMDYDAIPDTAALMAQHDVAVVSNLVADEVMYELILDGDAVLSRPEYEVVPPDMLEGWRTEGRHTEKYADQGEHRRDVEMPFFKELLKALHDAGVIVTIGTDTSLLEGSVPSNIHRELELLVESGLSTHQALAAGTSNAGRIAKRMHRDGSFGTVAAGQRADLLMLGDNPLQEVSHTRERVGVMAGGVWYAHGELDRMVTDLVATFGENKP